MKRFLKILVGLGILGFGIAVSAILWVNRPVAEKKQEEAVLPVVRVAPIEFREHVFPLSSQGVVEADRRTMIAAEVAGRVLEVSPDFEVGSRVSGKSGKPLVQIDPVDYEAALAQAKSTLEEAESVLANEEARSKQARSDWEKLGRSGEPPELVARKPQLESAEARVKAAEAAVRKAESDLARTRITVPYEAVVAKTYTEKGNYLVPGAQVAEVYEAGPYEVRLPLSVDEASFLRTGPDGEWTGTAEVRATVAGSTRRWNADIIRSEGEFDRETRSLYLVARIGDPKDPEGIEVRPGLFVQATIPSRAEPDVAEISAKAFRVVDEGEQVVVVDEDNLIRFREVKVVRRDREVVYVRGGIREGDRACLTELPDLIEETEVDPVPAATPEDGDATTPPNATVRN